MLRINIIEMCAKDRTRYGAMKEEITEVVPLIIVLHWFCISFD